MTQEVLKLALEALGQWYFGCGAGSASHDDAVAAIKEALAQPQQEPAAWLVECGGDSALVRHTSNFPGIFSGNEFIKRPLVFGDTTPPQRTWVGLSDDEALECWPGLAMYADCAKFWENIEAKLKAKNEH